MVPRGENRAGRGRNADSPTCSVEACYFFAGFLAAAFTAFAGAFFAAGLAAGFLAAAFAAGLAATFLAGAFAVVFAAGFAVVFLTAFLGDAALAAEVFGLAAVFLAAAAFAGLLAVTFAVAFAGLAATFAAGLVAVFLVVDGFAGLLVATFPGTLAFGIRTSSLDVNNKQLVVGRVEQSETRLRLGFKRGRNPFCPCFIIQKSSLFVGHGGKEKSRSFCVRAIASGFALLYPTLRLYLQSKSHWQVRIHVTHRSPS
ncbi:MAG: hypothetical protein CVU58_02355 [Deltaproteobacteria bacterium HGW-Deltaproteobacteria-16]|nr:MAG: hypothetical protein CVU58_02355 [Deltaproteobacteria bacterium HGW-Deltaproteobacteria-16]